MPSAKIDADEDRWPWLMALAQEGERGAYARLLTEVLPWLQAYAEAELGKGESARTAVHAALRSLHDRRHTYDPARPIGPWLAAIASAEVRRRLRQSRPGPGERVSALLSWAEAKAAQLASLRQPAAWPQGSIDSFS